MVSRTGIGAGIGIPFKNNALKGDKPYLPPEIKDSLKAVVIAYGKTNNDSDRAIVKNLVDASNPFVISNAAFKLNSGFGKYAADFLDWTSSKDAQKTSFEVKITSSNYKENWVAYKAPNTTFKAMKVRISGIPDGGYLQFFRTTADGGGIKMVNGINEIPAFTNTVVAGFYIDIPLGFDWSNLVIEQIPSFEGAFVTDGVNDLITSTKTVQEMGITNEVTVVSMIHQINANKNFTTTNNLRNESRVIGRNTVTNIGKTGIYGWYKEDLKGTTATLISNILGDKNDYTGHYIESTNPITNSKFYVTGYAVENGFTELSSVAWYWTIIANKVLTTDQINQVIAYFNLDRTLKPDILCNTIKQGITNENHAEFGDKLIDFSGNGRDIQLNNIAWDGDSGIGKYNYPNWKVNVTQGNKYARIVYYDSINGTYSADFKGITDLYKSYGLSIEIKANRANTVDFHSIKEDGIYTMTPPDDTTSIDIRFGGENVYNASCDITITQIPSHAGALCLDGVNDFGKVTGMPVYKDYTIVVDYERISGVEQAWAEALISKSYIANQGAFVLMETNGTAKHSYSFGAYTIFNKDDSTRTLLYQSKYKCGDVDLNAGTGIDGDTLWLGTYRDNYNSFFNGAIYSLMSFPYSMSEFLIERQLKKHKLGTLYPNMVEFRPVIKSNASYDNIVFYYKNEKVENGTYLTVGSSIGMHIRLSSNSVNEIKSITINGIPATFNFHDANNNIYQYDFNLTSKSPQKINITIDEYIRYEDIVQPYPVLLRFKDENGNEVSWGGKFKVGSTITRIGSIADPESNLLNGLYSISGLSLNGKGVTSSTSIVEKQMVFKTIATYLLDNNEPKCILSPRLLRIPNPSYKILGYIPDISGHGNHGVIHNSAYAEGSGVNEDGSYQLDGVDDFVTIPTLSSGGKQVLMKVNLPRLNEIIYDQRKETNTYTFAIITIPSQIAYDQRNSERITYIDGILNTNIIAKQLMGVTHNIVVINSKANLDNTRSPILGRDINGNNWSCMRIYDFMLFESISTDDKIKELNEYVGIEAKVELPPYYWDAYGKTNLDEDKSIIKQRGVAVGDYDLTNNNLAYDKMSGYGGYSFSPFSNTNDWRLSSSDNTMELLSIDGYSFTARRLEGSTWWKYKNKVTTNVSKNLTIKIRTNKSVRINWELKYRTSEMPDADLTLGLVSTLLSPNVITDVVLPVKTEEELNTLGAISHFYLIFFPPMDVPVGEEYTVEMLPLYPNGLLYDAVTDYSENVNIPVFTDFTAIMKRKWLKNQGCPLIKGSKVYEGGNGNALLFEWDKAYNFVFYKRTDIMEGEVPENISFITPTNYNGNVITRGSEQDTNGICIAGDGNAGFANMVFYKLILYPKTIPLLQINFLKNLMERDEIIDLNNPIFIQE